LAPFDTDHNFIDVSGSGTVIYRAPNVACYDPALSSSQTSCKSYKCPCPWLL